MTLYTLLKLLHILSAMVFFGTGLGTAYFKFRADRSGDLRVIAWTAREVVQADWRFTVPSGILLPLSGGIIVQVVKFGWSSPWIWWALSGYALAGLCWLPAAWMQIRMRDLAEEALAKQTELSPKFHAYARWWTILGFPSFLAAMVVIWVMITKYAAWTWAF